MFGPVVEYHLIARKADTYCTGGFHIEQPTACVSMQVEENLCPVTSLRPCSIASEDMSNTAAKEMKVAKVNGIMNWLLSISMPVLLGTSLPVAAEQSYPGKIQLPTYVAADFFARVCAANVPKIDRANGVLAKDHFWQRPETRTFYHPKYNMSFKILERGGGTCSMVFASREKPEELAVTFGMAAAMAVKSRDKSPEVDLDIGPNVSRVVFDEGWVFEFEPGAKSNGESYFHARISIRPED